MNHHDYRGNIRQQRIPLRLRRLEPNRYRLANANGRGLEYRKKAELPSAIAAHADTAAGKDVLVEARLNRSGRWSITGVINSPQRVARPHSVSAGTL